MFIFDRGSMFIFDSESIIYDKACIIIINTLWRAIYIVDENIIATPSKCEIVFVTYPFKMVFFPILR